MKQCSGRKIRNKLSPWKGSFLGGWHYSLSIPIYIYVWGQLFFRSFCGFVISLKAKREPIREEFKLGTNYSCDTQLVSSPIIPHSSVQCLVHTCVLVRAILKMPLPYEHLHLVPQCPFATLAFDDTKIKPFKFQCEWALMPCSRCSGNGNFGY